MRVLRDFELSASVLLEQPHSHPELMEPLASVAAQMLGGILERFRERCAQEADREVATCKHLGHDDYYPRMAATHIREIDIQEWLKKIQFARSSAPVPPTASAVEPLAYAVDPDTTAIYCRLRSGQLVRRYASGPAWGREWGDASESLVPPALQWHPVTQAELGTFLADLTSAPADKEV